MKTTTKLLGHAALSVALLLASGCKQGEETPPVSTDPSSSSEFTEQAFPGKKGKLVTGFIGETEVVAEEIEGHYVFEGDILVSPQSPASSSNERITGVGRLTGRWTSGIMYYTIGSTISSTKRQRILDAIAHWESKTSIRFVTRTTQGNYVEFVNSSGCSSFVGMIGGRQTINIGDGCSTGNIIHEIGHALGLHHEQTRIDRDNHVIIHWENISSGSTHNFNKNSASTAFDHGAMDFGSVMMYGPYSFSSNGKPTITKKDGSTYNVQRNGLSTGDIGIIGVMYGGTTNQAPNVSITSPSSGATFTAPANITITASATDSDGSITKVVFYNEGKYLGEDNSSPYTYTMSNVAAGSYSLTATTTDDKNATKTSTAVTISVQNGNSGPLVATMYQHCNYSTAGYAIGLAAGDYATLTGTGIRDNDISSLKIQSGYEIIVYQYENFSGLSYTFRADDACLVDNNINDWVSSIRIRKVQPPVTVYQHCDFSTSGYGVTLDPGDYTIAQLIAKGIRDNDISSLKVQTGYEAILYVSDNFSGSNYSFKADDSCLVDNNLNDQVTSIRIRRIQ